MTKSTKYRQQILKLKAFHEKHQNATSPTEAHDYIVQLKDMLKWVGKIENQIAESIFIARKQETEREKASVLSKLFARNQDGEGQRVREYELELQSAQMLRQSVMDITIPKLKMFIVGVENAGIPPTNYKQYIQSTAWRMKAEEAKANAGNRCQICNKSRAEVQLDAHHRTYERLGDEQSQDITVLCRDCHQLYEDEKKGKVVDLGAKCRQCGDPFQPLSDYHQYCKDCYLAKKSADTEKEITPEPVESKPEQGFCIRCQTNIKLNPQSPYCYQCFKSWKRYENEDFREKACHVCGKSQDTTRLKPVCYSCYKATKKILAYY